MSDDRFNKPPIPASAWASTEVSAPATQIVGDREAYLGQGVRDVGRRVSDTQAELFVTGDPVAALRDHFDRLAPEFIALHDIGTANSRRLLAAVASAQRGQMQTLAIRSQGHGVNLAELAFVELVLGDGSRIRLYSTEVSAGDARAKQQLTLLLISHSRLAALLVGDVDRNSLYGALHPLREAITRGPWPNGDLLLIPLAAVPSLSAEASQLGGRSGVTVQVTPRAARASEVWGFISGAWNRVQGRTGGKGLIAAAAAAASEAPTQPAPLPPGPPPVQASAPAPAPLPRPGAVNWEHYAQRCGSIRGAVSCCVFDLHTQRPVAQVAARSSADRVAQQSALLMTTIVDAARAMGLGGVVREAAITLADHHLLLLPVRGHPGIVLQLTLDASATSAQHARLLAEQVHP